MENIENKKENEDFLSPMRLTIEQMTIRIVLNMLRKRLSDFECSFIEVDANVIGRTISIAIESTDMPSDTSVTSRIRTFKLSSIESELENFVSEFARDLREKRGINVNLSNMQNVKVGDTTSKLKDIFNEMFKAMFIELYGHMTVWEFFEEFE